MNEINKKKVLSKNFNGLSFLFINQDFFIIIINKNV